ncbi:endo-beta-N-acetylglucosaminidase, partial [human gut metagenome]
ADQVYYRLNTTTSQPVTISVSPDLSLVDTYNDANQTNLQPLPAENVSIGNGGALTVAAGTAVSDPLEVTFSADGLAPGTYLLPLALQTDADVAEGQALYYGITVRKFDKNIYQDGYESWEIPLDTDWNTIFYLNTSEVQAHYADYVALETIQKDEFKTTKQASLGNIIVLRIAQVDYDTASQRVIFAPTSDLFYTLEHSDKYIAQMKDKGRKISVCIEGAGKGVGFCNMTDAQIADFVSQVKSFVDTYDLDGVNLWDRGSGYGKEGMPAMNTTSYPKLIKSMRETLGEERLLTVVDHEEPTEYFWDTEATGGIAVGDYIDYAWHGYVSQNEPIEFCDPYNPSSMFPQVHPRKAIAGLDKNRYGTVNVPFYTDGSDLAQDMTMELWMMNTIMWGLERSNNIIVFDNLDITCCK